MGIGRGTIRDIRVSKRGIVSTSMGIGRGIIRDV
jgi:hypothetical protein